MSSEALRLLSGSSDEEKFAGLALLTKVRALRPDGSDLAAKNLSKAMPSLVASIGQTFIRRLLLSYVKSRPEHEEGKGSNSEDKSTNGMDKKDEGGNERMENNYGRLGVGFLSAVASTLCENDSEKNEMKPSSYEAVCLYLSGHADMLVKLLEPSTGREDDENDLHHDCVICLTVIAERCEGGQERLGRLDAWSVALGCLEKGDESELLLVFLVQLHRPEPKHLEKLVSSCAHPATEVVHDMERLRLLSMWLLRVPDSWRPTTSFVYSVRVALVRGFCCTARDDMRDTVLSVLAILLKKMGGGGVDLASDMNAQFLRFCVSCACGEARIMLDESLASPHCPVERRSRVAQVLPVIVSIFCQVVALLCENGEQEGWSELPAESLISIRHSLEGCYRTILEYIIEIGGKGYVIGSGEDNKRVVVDLDDDTNHHRLFQVALVCAALPAVGLFAAEDPETLETELVTALPSIVCILQERASAQKHGYYPPEYPLYNAAGVVGGTERSVDGSNGQAQQHHPGVVVDDYAEEEQQKEAPPEEFAYLFRALWSLSPSSLEPVLNSNIHVLLLKYLVYFQNMYSSDVVPLKRLPPCEPTAYACSLLVDLNLVDLSTTTIVSVPTYDDGCGGDDHELQKQSITIAFDLAQIVARRKPVDWSQVVATCVHLSLVCCEGLTEQYCSSFPWNSLKAVTMEALDVEHFDFYELEAYAWSESVKIASGEGDATSAALLKSKTQGLCVILEEQWQPPTNTTTTMRG